MITSVITSVRVAKPTCQTRPTPLAKPNIKKPVLSATGNTRHLCRSFKELQDPSILETALPALELPHLDRDEYKESSRARLRTVFDFDRWAAHRSTTRYTRHMSGIFTSRMIRGLAPTLSFVAALSTSVATFHQLVDCGIIETPENVRNIVIFSSAQPLLLTSTVLGLLLVFRTNASYARWLDARKSWGILVNRSRDLVRQGLTWCPEEEHALRDMLCRWIIAFSISLKCHLRVDEDAIVELAELDILPYAELVALAATQHRPNYALQVLSTVLRELARVLPSANSTLILNMDMNLTAIEDVAGTCERILSTPIPLAYSRHTSRFMIIWLSALPFALWEPLHWGMVPTCFVISALTLGVEDIGVLIEEPFSILPLEVVCSTIRGNIVEMLEIQNAESGEDAGNNGGGGNGESIDVVTRKVSASELVRRAKFESDVSNLRIQAE
ncbi:hypothetical protein Ndes2437A_g06840 [Nannochloris sp. 'desiccata']